MVEPPRASLPGDPPRSSALDAVTGDKPKPPPLDPPMVPFSLAGLGVFAVAGLALLPFRGWLSTHGDTDWLWVCLAGFLVGLPGLAVMIRHDVRRRRRRSGR